MNHLVLCRTNLVSRLLLISLLLLPVTVHADRSLARPLPADVPPPDLAALAESCDPATATEGRWLLRNDAFAWRAHSLVFDSMRDRLIAFGGTNLYNRGVVSRDSVSNQTWVRSADLSSPWQLLATAGPLPPPRQDHTAIYDPVGDRMIVYGGMHRPRGTGDVWQLDFTASPPRWSELHPAGPRPLARFNHAAIYDPVRRRMVIFGGVAGDWGRGLYDFTNEFWELTLDGPPTWRRLLLLGGALARTEGARGTYDSLRNRWILSGGTGRILSTSGTFFTTDVVAIDLATMQTTHLPNVPRGPHALFDHSITYDARQDRLLVFGGAEDFADGVLALWLADLGSGWRTLASATSWPESRVEHADWFDERRNRLLIIGGGHTGNPIPGTNVLWFGRQVRVALDPASNAPFNPRSHRPLTVVLYGSDSLAATELEPSTIRVGQAVVLRRAHDRLAFSLRDVDGDGYLDALVDVDGHAIGVESASLPVDVQALTKVGDGVCGKLDLDQPVTPGRLVENPDLDRRGAKAQPTTAAGIELSALLGPATRGLIQLRVQIPSSGRFALELWSVRGSLLASAPLQGPVDQVVALRPAARLAPGVYWARISGAATGPALRLVIGG